MSSEDGCPCGGATYEGCCARVHTSGAGLGATAESLMRARYSAYVLANEAFLLGSWHPETRPQQVRFDRDVAWLGLDIEDTSAGTGLDQQGQVQFRARFRRGDEHLELHERSTFVRIDGSWVYVDGEAP